jgi:hypothetical protein
LAPLSERRIHPCEPCFDALNLFGSVQILWQAGEQISNGLHQDDDNPAQESLSLILKAQLMEHLTAGQRSGATRRKVRAIVRLGAQGANQRARGASKSGAEKS